MRTESHDRESIPELPNRLGIEGIEFIEYATSKPQALGQVLEMMGFRPIARHRSREVLLYRQGSMNVIVNAHDVGMSHSVAPTETPVIAALAFRVRDAAAAYKRAEAARRQYDELLNTRRAKAMELSEVASSAMDRARRYVDVLRDSQRVREFTYEQWSQIGRRSLFDVMSAEGDHFNLLVAYVNALHDTFEANAQLRSLGGGLVAWLHIEE